MNKIDIGKILPHEVKKLQEIGKQTFWEAFSEGNKEEDIKKYLEDEFSIEKLNLELSDENAIFYFAMLNEEVIGYLKLNIGQSQTELKDIHALEIKRIYVLKKFHGKKVGQILYNKAIEVARQKELKYIWLGVWEKNLRAINFYLKNGFIEFDKHFFMLGKDKQIDLMMKLDLEYQ